MGQVIEQCRTCGFDIPTDEERCPSCERTAQPSRAARQVASLVLPTRSVHALPTTRSRRDRPIPPIGRASAARSAFSFTTALVLLTFAAAGLAWLASQPHLALQLPEGTAGRLDDITTVSATASIAAFAVGLVAALVWSVRAAERTIRQRVSGRQA